jgi:hypothetical protein
MLENNVFRLIMLIGAVVIFGILLSNGISNYDDFKNLFAQFFSNRLQKY